MNNLDSINKISLEETRQRQAEISALLHATRAVLELHEFKDTARSIFDLCKNLIGATAGYVALLSKDGIENEVLFLDSGGLPCTVDTSLPMPIRGLRAEAYRTGRAVYHNDFYNSAWVKYMPQGHVRLENVLFAPLLIKGKAVGLLGLSNKPRGFTENDANLSSTFGEIAAIGLLNSRTLESLENSEERIRSIVETANDAIISADSHGNIVLWNHAAETIFGYSAWEIVGKPLTLIMPERFREAHQKGVNRMVSRGESKIIGKTIVMAGIKRDDTEFPIELSLASWKTKEMVLFTGVIRDITERKKAEESLQKAHTELEKRVTERTKELRATNETLQREMTERKWVEEELGASEERYRRTLDNMLEGCQIIGFDWKYIYINDAVVIQGHRAKEELLGRTMMETYPGIENTEMFGSLKLCMEKRTSHRMENEFTFPDGSKGWFELSFQPVHEGVFIVSLDITERKRAEKILTKLSSAVQQTADVVVITDRNGAIEYVNPAFEKITGYAKEEAIGKTPKILKSGKHDKKFYEHLWRTILSGEVFHGILINKKKNGEIYHSEKTITPIKDGNGNITHFVSTDKDITERLRAEEIRIENERLEFADKAKSEFLASMSHELRTPLNSIIGFSELLKQKTAGDLNGKQDHYLDNVIASGTFLLNLINDILDLSKVEAGKIELVIDKMSVPVTINETLTLIKEKASKHNVLLKTEFDPALSFIEADKQRFKQILFNLLSNAVKFSKEEGGIVTITAKKEGEMAMISVSDTGIGIREENLEKLFKKFEQLDSKISNKYGGTGLGLAITKKLVELHGGKIWAESMYGEGSTFTFLLPLAGKKIEEK